MENEIKENLQPEMEPKKEKFPILSLLVVIGIIVGAVYYIKQLPTKDLEGLSHPARFSAANKAYIEKEAVKLPITWGNLGVQMAQTGVIDENKFKNLYSSRGGLPQTDIDLLDKSDNGNLVINRDNAGVVLNMLWALGLSNKNQILEQGPMMDPQYGGAKNFASTGGWTLGKGDAMLYYSKFELVKLTPEEQVLVERVAKNIYRPCCNNSTYFPDCNHGMAMLGLLELMASQGVNEADMYKFALKVNELWFPDTYSAIRTYLASKNTDMDTVPPKEILGVEYSSATGYKKILSQIKPQQQKGSSCGA